MRREIRRLECDIDALLDEHGTTLRDEPRIGPIAAATLIEPSEVEASGVEVSPVPPSVRSLARSSCDWLCSLTRLSSAVEPESSSSAPAFSPWSYTPGRLPGRDGMQMKRMRKNTTPERQAIRR